MTDSFRPPKLDKIVKRFASIDNAKRRFEQILWYSKKLDVFPEEKKIPQNKVSGCASQVYIDVELKDGIVTFEGDSDSQFTKGLLALLVDVLSDLKPTEIIRVKSDFIKETKLDVSMTPSRANGFYNIFKTIQEKVLLLIISPNA